jgi:hypothetical protein
VTSRQRAEQLLGPSQTDLRLVRQALYKRYAGLTGEPEARVALPPEERIYLQRYAAENGLPASLYLNEEIARKLMSEGAAISAAASIVRDPEILREIRDYLYELNFDPGSEQGPSMGKAIREYQIANHLPNDGEPTDGLLRRLREAGQLHPWGAIVYAKGANWGMSWDHPTRKQAVAAAHSSCGAARCSVELSFAGAECGAFSNSVSGWAIVAGDTVEAAKKGALEDCAKHGKACRVVAAVCANGTGRFTAAK